MSTISIVVPVYNTEMYLRRCVDSILAQSFTDFDLVLVDDGSNDNGALICDEYARLDARVTVIHQQNLGLSAARNAGIIWALENSDSRYLSFIDSDDWVHPRYLEWLYSAIRDNNCKVSAGKFIKVTDTCAFEAEASVSITPPEKLYCESVANFIVAWGKLFLKEDFRELRFPAGKIHEDEFTTWKILFKYDSIAFISTPIYAYYQRPDSIMGTWTPARLVKSEAVSEQLEWMEINGSSRMLIKARQRLAITYAEQISGMISCGMPSKTIRAYRKQLQGYIIDNQKQLPFRSFVSTYEMAWPVEVRTLRLIYSVLKRIKHVVSR